MIFVIKGCLPWKLLNPFSSKDLHIGYPQWWFSLIGSFWWMKLYLYWLERLWLHMCSVLAKCLLATCTFELWKGTHDIFVVVTTFCLVNGRPNVWLLGCLRWVTLMVQLWFQNYNFLIGCPLFIRSLLTSRMKGQICKLVSVLWISMFHVQAWVCWNYLIDHLWACPIKTLPICDYEWESGPWTILCIHKECSTWYLKLYYLAKEV